MKAIVGDPFSSCALAAFSGSCRAFSESRRYAQDRIGLSAKAADITRGARSFDNLRQILALAGD
jgi:hypothetical protein